MYVLKNSITFFLHPVQFFQNSSMVLKTLAQFSREWAEIAVLLMTAGFIEVLKSIWIRLSVAKESMFKLAMLFLKLPMM